VEYFFHQQTGVLIVAGASVVLSPNESLVLGMFIKGYPKPLLLSQISAEANRCRANGGITNETIRSVISFMRDKLGPIGFNIVNVGMFCYALVAKPGVQLPARMMRRAPRQVQQEI